MSAPGSGKHLTEAGAPVPVLLRRALFWSRGHFERGPITTGTPLMHEMRRDGVDL